VVRGSSKSFFGADAELFFYDGVPMVTPIALAHPLVVAASAILTNESGFLLSHWHYESRKEAAS
jgi:hypothetical protein